MNAKRTLRLIVLLLILAGLSVYAFRSYIPQSLYDRFQPPLGVEITDAKMSTEFDNQLMPLQVTDVFPRGTARVFCWFSWDNTLPNTPMKAEWYYALDDVHILTYDFKIPRKKGSGGISLIMPSGKVFPVGEYRVDLVAKDRTLRSLTFSVK